MLPKAFNKYGLLPPRDYDSTIVGLRKSLLVKGPVNKSEYWNSERRLYLVNNLEILVKQLWKVGIKDIYINGSFVENKDYPNDIDGYFECGNILNVVKYLKQLYPMDPHKVWTYIDGTRKPDPDFPQRKKTLMWHVYKVELWPNYNQLVEGIQNKAGEELPYPEMFRQTFPDCRPKGIVKIIK